MSNQIKHACVLLLALPLVAQAQTATQPVTVVTRSTGTVEVEPTVLRMLGAADHLQQADTLPYELTLTSNYDWPGPLPARNEQANSWYPRSIAIDFRVGDFNFHYDGAGSVLANLRGFTQDSDLYYHDLTFSSREAVYTTYYGFIQELLVPIGSLGQGGPLTPTQGEGSYAGGQLQVSYMTPWLDSTRYYRMFGDIGTYSVQVTSPVPEASAYAMLAVGMLTLGLRRRVGRTSISRGKPVRRRRPCGS